MVLTAALTHVSPSGKKQTSGVRTIKISALAEISFLNIIKGRSPMRLDEFILPLLGVEFTNSYQDYVNSTSHFDAHLSGFGLIIDAF